MEPFGTNFSEIVIQIQTFLFNKMHLKMSSGKWRPFCASEVSLMDMGKSVNVQPQQSTAKQKPCAYFLGYTVLSLVSKLISGYVFGFCPAGFPELVFGTDHQSSMEGLYTCASCFGKVTNHILFLDCLF